MTEAMETKMIHCIAHYRMMEEMNSVMLIEIKDQYRDMAAGGEGRTPTQASVIRCSSK